MANNNSYHIYIHLDDLSQETAVAGETEKKGGASNESTYGEKTAKSAQKAVKGLVAYSLASSTADRIISGQIGQVSLRTGAEEYEQRLSATYSIAKQSMGAVTALGIGIATGTWPLVLAGLAVQGINQAINIGQKKQKLQLQQNLENVSIEMQNIRAGTAGRRGN